VTGSCSHRYFPFAFSPISTSRRMASERPGSSSCWAAHASNADQELGARAEVLLGMALHRALLNTTIAIIAGVRT
jgi:hypothetical protein